MAQYPGLGLDLRHVSECDPHIYPNAMLSVCWAGELLLMREVAMMVVMDRVMDEPDWHRKVFDPEFVAKWTLETLAQNDGWLYDQIAAIKDLRYFIYSGRRSKSLLDNSCLIYCVKELQDKARFFEVSGLAPTLDAYATVIKTDTLIPKDMGDSLRGAFKRLSKDSTSALRRQNTSATVRDLVDPALFPLVYGRTPVLQEEAVGVADAIDRWAGKGTVIPKPPHVYYDIYDLRNDRYHARWCYWSEAYQWLSTNVKFEKDGRARLTSYINNLHPTKYRDIHQTIEELVNLALPMWDHCVWAYNHHDPNRFGPGRRDARFPMPENRDDDDLGNWAPPVAEEPPSSAAQYQSPEWMSASDSHNNGYIQRNRRYWKKTRKAVHPAAPAYEPVDYTTDPDHALKSQFASTGLQVFVRMRSVELTPENPTLPEVPWHVEGNANEHIVGTAIYCVESENVSAPNLSFSVDTEHDQLELAGGILQAGSGWAEQAYGVSLHESHGSTLVQNCGSVELKEGRLVAFPTVFHTRFSSCGRVDRTKSGCLKFVVLWLVDPLTRIISTANVPPQRADWWLERAFGNEESSLEALPREVAQLVLEKTGGGDMADALRSHSIGDLRLPLEIWDMICELAEGLPMGWEEAEYHLERLGADTEGIQGCMEEVWRNATYFIR